MRPSIYIVTLILTLAVSCTKFDEADLTDRKTFVHFYSSAVDYIGSAAELDTDGGYILSGEVRHDNGVTDALIIKTDARGHKLWEKVIPKGIVNGIKPTEDGYILVGDSVQLNPLSAEVNELVNTYARVIMTDRQGNITARHISAGSILVTENNRDIIRHIDYHGQAVALDPSGNIIVLGSFRVPGENESSYVSAFNPADISDSLWHISYKSLEHDYVNCNSVHVTTASNIAWASKLHTPEQGFAREFLSVPYVGPNSAPIKHSVFGERDARNHSVEDMQRSPVGYCAIGTYSETSGLNANIYFIRIDASMEIIPESVRYIDGEELILNDRLLTEADKTSSTSFDEGLAVTATSDGFVLAGAMTSTPMVGNGGKDILLVKLDAVGNLLWKKTIGGTGDEVITSIRETPDRGLLLFGTNTINGLSSMMLIKTDANGDITN